MIAYLDNSATTRPRQPVIDKMTQAMREGFFNPSSLYAPAMAAEKSAEPLPGRHSKRLEGGPGAGDLYLRRHGGQQPGHAWGAGAMHGPQHVMVSAVEHPSVLAAAQALEKGGTSLDPAGG